MLAVHGHIVVEIAVLAFDLHGLDLPRPEDVVALEEDSFACELEEPADTLDEEFSVLEEELLSEEVSFAEDDSAVDDVSADADSAEEYSISVSELSGSSCSAPVAELSLSPQDASNKAKKMQ